MKPALRRKCCDSPRGAGPHAAGCANAETAKPKPKAKASPIPTTLTWDWDGRCVVCGTYPVVVQTGMCRPCTFGVASEE